MRQIFLAAALLLPALAPASAAFDFRHGSARSAAMGGSFLASDGEAAALFSHPAGLGGLAWPEAGLLYAKPQAGLEGVDLSAGQLVFGLPTRAGAFAAGYYRFQADTSWAESAYAAGYGVKVRGVRAGVTVKRLELAYRPGADPLAADDPVFSRGASRHAAALDAGLAVPVLRLLEVGVAVRNVNRPDLGLATEDRLPREVQAGVSLDLLGLRTCGDLLFSGGESSPAFSLGLEKTFRRAFALRAGVNALEYAAGFGVAWGDFALDYAAVFSKSLLNESAGSHKAGVTYRFASVGAR